MEHYTFPHITDIGQVLKAIEGRPEFVVAERDRHTIVNYVVSGNDTFPPVMLEPDPFNSSVKTQDMNAAILRECRGIVFGPDGTVIARRFHKFFNYGEREETHAHNVSFARPHVIMDKLDGSMITPIPIADDGKSIKNGYHVRWGTKMGLTSVAFQAEEYVASRPIYTEFAEFCIDRGLTPIFEWCSRKQRIVIDYPKDTLTLVAVRDNITGIYSSYTDLWAFATEFDIPLVNVLPDEQIRDAAAFRSFVSDQENIEGYVIRFDTGHMLKMKGDWYVRIHRAKDHLLHEKRVVEMVASEKSDDVKPFLLDHDLKALQSFEWDFFSGYWKTVQSFKFMYSILKGKHATKKDFAISDDAKLMTQMERSTMFAVWDLGPDEIADHLRKFILKNLGSQTKVDSVRWIWGGVKWADYIQAQEE